MKNFILTIVGVATLLIALTLNFRHALDDYGVTKNKLHLEVLAQTNNTGGGGTSGGGTSGGGTSGGDSSGGGTTPSCPVGTSYHSGAIDNFKPCTATEIVTCSIGITIPIWVPEIGGLSCEFDISYPIKVQGSENACTQTGNSSQYCCSYSCRRNP